MPPPNTPVRVGPDASLTLAGVGECGSSTRRELHLDPSRPLAILVHGCDASAENFGTLARVFELHDQQTVCFRYDDRASVTETAGQLRSAISALSARLSKPEVLVLGHSQGGLVAREALTTDTASARPLPEGHYRLVTISSPFGGIKAAKHCGSVLYHIASFGVTVAICRGISGAKWNEIHPRARMVREPATLEGAVDRHVTVVTDERDSCRRYAPDGRHCIQDDFVFSVAEQHNARMERDRRVVADPIAAGHVEVVGVQGREPKKLLNVLQQHGLLEPTDPDRRQAVEQLTAKHGW